MHSDMSRRSALGAGAAALAAAVPLTAAGPALASERRKLVIGANEGWYTKVHNAVPAVSCRRVYIPGHNDIPAQWPSTGNARTTLVSIRPVPADLLAGRLDTRIRAFVRTAPPGSDLNAWHEAGNLAGYPAYITAPAMRAVHAHMHRLCRNSNVRYGPILCMPPRSMAPWMLYPRLAQWRAVIQQFTNNPSPVLNICETNTPRLAYRAQWFTAVAGWMSRNGGGRMLTYWSRAHRNAGPWRPHDRAVIRSLRHAATL